MLKHATISKHYTANPNLQTIFTINGIMFSWTGKFVVIFCNLKTKHRNKLTFEILSIVIPIPYVMIFYNMVIGFDTYVYKSLYNSISFAAVFDLHTLNY